MAHTDSCVSHRTLDRLYTIAQSLSLKQRSSRVLQQTLLLLFLLKWAFKDCVQYQNVCLTTIYIRNFENKINSKVNHIQLIIIAYLHQENTFACVLSLNYLLFYKNDDIHIIE